MNSGETDKAPGETSRDVLAPRVYWIIAGIATAMIAFLYWLTEAVNIPLPPP